MYCSFRIWTLATVIFDRIFFLKSIYPLHSPTLHRNFLLAMLQLSCFCLVIGLNYALAENKKGMKKFFKTHFLEVPYHVGIGKTCDKFERFCSGNSVCYQNVCTCPVNTKQIGRICVPSEPNFIACNFLKQCFEICPINSLFW